MITIINTSSPETLAEAAAELSCDILTRAITKNNSAVWVLSGGTSPILTYRVIISKYLSLIDWTKVVFILGDERIVPFRDKHSNWQNIDDIFLKHIKGASFLRPKYELGLNMSVSSYNQTLASLKSNNLIPNFDLIWLGVGEDGHTLSLFPGSDALNSTQLVDGISDSPKAPKKRLTLTIKTLKNSQNALVFISGKSKRESYRKISEMTDLPITRAINAIDNSNGKVYLLVDKDARAIT